MDLELSLSPGLLATPDVTIWRRRHALVFVWPAEGPVRLVAGDGAARSYDIAALADRLLVRRWKPAVAGPTEDLSEGGVPGLRLGGLALAGVALLGLIHRMLPPD